MKDAIQKELRLARYALKVARLACAGPATTEYWAGVIMGLKIASDFLKEKNLW